MKKIIYLCVIVLLSSFSATCYAQADTIAYNGIKLPSVHLMLKMPNDKWKSFSEQVPVQEVYSFMRKPFDQPPTDTTSREPVAIMELYIMDGASFKHDVTAFYGAVRSPIVELNAVVDDSLTKSSEKYPLQSKNGILVKCSYKSKSDNADHIFYGAYVITGRDQGVMLLLDTTKALAEKCEPEFKFILRSLKETDD